MPGSGRRNVVADKHVIVLGDAAVVVTGFYDFFRLDQPGVPRPSRYTMVIVKSDDRWRIAHHHSSPRSATRQ